MKRTSAIPALAPSSGMLTRNNTHVLYNPFNHTHVVYDPTNITSGEIQI